MDTGSRERYQSLTAQYYNRANVIILVCSLDSEHTLTCLNKWHAEAQYYIDSSNIIYAIVGTKSDLPDTEREVTTDMLHNFASHLNIPEEYVLEASSATGEGVEEVINTLCGAIVQRFANQTPGIGMYGSSFMITVEPLTGHNTRTSFNAPIENSALF